MQKSLLLPMLVAACLLPCPCRAQARPTLAAALPTARVPGIVLSVGAEQVPLAPEMTPPAPGASPMALAQAFGRVARRFGTVTALAPPTMTVFYAPSGPPDIYAGLSMDDALKLLAASLSSAQWNLLVGAQGIGLSDLTTDQQRSLFRALFPDPPLLVEKGLLGPPDPATPHPDHFSELPQARFRLSQSVTLGVSSSRHAHSWVGGFGDDFIHRQYHVVRDFSGSAREPRLFGQKTQDTQPNAPKQGQLNFRAPLLQAAVTLDGAKTVADVIARVAQATHLELYADSRYETQSVTFVGAGQASAADLLQALAFCLTAAYRQVGPAYVLTEDVLGSQTHRTLWEQWQAAAMRRLAAPVNEAQAKIAKAHSLRDLSDGGSPLAIQPEQYGAEDKADHIDWGDGAGHLVLTFDKLTPAQQARVTTGAAEEAKNGSQSNGQPPSLSGTALLSVYPKLELLLPSLDAPVWLSGGLPNLFQPAPSRGTPPNLPVKSLTETLPMIPRRAVLLAPQTPAQVSALLPVLRRYGFTELWLRVFYRGKTMDSRALARALTEAPKQGIAVFADVDLLRWGADAPPEAQEISAVGQNSATAFRHLAENADSDAVLPRLPATPFLYVSPAAPVVRATLISLLRRLARTPKLAGIVLDSPAAPGYACNMEYPRPQDEYGYTLPLRLAFLRQSHADPLDVTPSHIFLLNGKVNSSDTLANDWDALRAEANLAFLRELMAAASARPILIRQRRADDNTLWEDWYGAWENLKSPPVMPNQGVTFEDGMAIQWARLKEARMQSRVAIRRYQPLRGENLNDFADSARPNPGQAAWDGAALDLEDDVDLSAMLPAPAAKP